MTGSAATVSSPAALAPRRAPAASPWLGRAILALATLGLLWLVFTLFASGQALVAVAVMAFGGAALWIYGTAHTMAWKYLFPGIAGMLIFVAFPLLYTVQIGFTNYSSSNLLEQDRSRAYLLEQRTVDEASLLTYTVHREAGGLRLKLQPAEGGEALVTPVITAAPGQALALAAGDASTLGPAAGLREVIAQRELLQRLELRRADGAVLRYVGLREFGVTAPLWQAAEGQAIRRVADNALFTPNTTSGYFESSAGERMPPGFTVGIGLANYSRMLLDADFRGPFVQIFIWTVLFAGLTVVFSAAIGMTLAVLLNWEALRFRTLYRTLLFLPYAVPGFISILVFKGLFNQNFGEINAILDALFGIRPAWFADPLLAKAMLLTVNTWLGFPYFMVLCTGLIKAIPSDLYEASALAGAGPLTNFFRITAPLVAKPLTPLLISAFAFNFNNFVLISLLTDGRPDFLNTKLPAGTTDILVSYTYRIAFTDSGQNFGLAAAISTLIFIMVALMALVQLRYTQAPAAKR
jgi:maltose/maltodextrin transport system permease protein